jgi:hypothetical protein
MRFDASRPAALGRAEGGSSVRIVDDRGSDVAAGVSGAVQLSLGDAPRRRYDGDPAASAEVFLPGGWVRTGDVGYLDGDGYLHLVDRQADLVISGGINISTIEVEAVLHEFPGVIEAAVVGLPHPALGEYVAAAVRPDEALSLSRLNAFLEQRLGAVRAPKRIVLVDELPRSALGKVLKRELRAQLASAGGRPSFLAPSTPTERRVAQYWQRALGVERVGCDDDFLALGGSSLSALEIVGRVREELGRQVGQRDLFEAATLAVFAARVDRAEVVEAGARPAIRPVPRRPAAD